MFWVDAHVSAEVALGQKLPPALREIGPTLPGILSVRFRTVVPGSPNPPDGNGGGVDPDVGDVGDVDPG